ncbi:unnamed protein product [Mytilus coruscus]|uniref:Short-chain collagen C4-like n=1 Tax=Mytilus coruscus TaxID=42192 RepID=A0A6J8ALU1_MYTCO|nr:unnamed protein product [Mytilus coruscus]
MKFVIGPACIWTLFLSFSSSGNLVKNEKSKRLLLNDPDAIIARLTHMENEILKLKVENQNLRQTVDKVNGFGSTYVRWGRTSCPGSKTDLVYSGYTAGQSYYHSGSKSYYGGPSNTLCLPNNPELSNTTFSYHDTLLFGSEYERNTFAFDSANEDIPCAVCRSKNASTTLMIPGRKSCFSGWSSEYSGLLASGSVYHGPSSYICVDSHPEYLQAGKDDRNGHRFYMVGFQCGSLHCPPYHDDRVAYCVVCSK